MENIVIDGYLYKCKPGTNARIISALSNAHCASREEHENGTAYIKFNSLLEKIKSENIGEFIFNVYQTT